MRNHFNVKKLKKVWWNILVQKIWKNLKNKKIKIRGNPHMKSCHFWPSCVRRPSWSSKCFLHFCRPNTRALCTQVALSGLRPFLSPWTGSVFGLATLRISCKIHFSCKVGLIKGVGFFGTCVCRFDSSMRDLFDVFF